MFYTDHKLRDAMHLQELKKKNYLRLKITYLLQYVHEKLFGEQNISLHFITKI